MVEYRVPPVLTGGHQFALLHAGMNPASRDRGDAAQQCSLKQIAWRLPEVAHIVHGQQVRNLRAKTLSEFAQRSETTVVLLPQRLTLLAATLPSTTSPPALAMSSRNLHASHAPASPASARSARANVQDAKTAVIART